MHIAIRTVSRAISAIAIAAIVIASGTPHTLHAQASAPPKGSPRKIISVNPFLPLAGYFQAEFEAKLRENLAFALSGSHTELDDRYTAVDAKLRLYPQENGLEGFAIAAGLGFGRLTNVAETFCTEFGNCRETRRSTSGPSFSVETHYQWLLGRSQNTAVAIGGGVKRFYVDDKVDGFDAFDEYVPTLRLTIGYAFR